MKRTIAFWVLVFICARTSAQVNLVPNGSFEQQTNCPNNSAQIDFAVPWSDPPTYSADLFDSCGMNNLTVPSNDAGFEIPLQGSAYAGIYCYFFSGNDYREYLEVKLTDTLKSNTRYCVSFHVSLADSFQYAIGDLSAYLSSNGGGNNPNAYFSYVPQINNPSTDILSSKNGWTLISGSFVASGNEQYITIGNFKTDALTNSLFVGGSSTGGPFDWREAYYYIDDISVIEIAPCTPGNNVTICPGDSVQLGTDPMPDISYSWSPVLGISDTTAADPIVTPTITTTYTLTQTQCDVISTATVTVTVKPETDCAPPLVIPTLLMKSEMLKITGAPPGSTLAVYDTAGRKVFWTDNYTGEFGGPGVAAGNYVVWFELPGGTVYRQKLCVIK